MPVVQGRELITIELYDDPFYGCKIPASILYEIVAPMLRTVTNFKLEYSLWKSLYETHTHNWMEAFYKPKSPTLFLK